MRSRLDSECAAIFTDISAMKKALQQTHPHLAKDYRTCTRCGRRMADYEPGTLHAACKPVVR